jgi:hypothetical protein
MIAPQDPGVRLSSLINTNERQVGTGGATYDRPAHPRGYRGTSVGKIAHPARRASSSRSPPSGDVSYGNPASCPARTSTQTAETTSAMNIVRVSKPRQWLAGSASRERSPPGCEATAATRASNAWPPNPAAAAHAVGDEDRLIARPTRPPRRSAQSSAPTHPAPVRGDHRQSWPVSRRCRNNRVPDVVEVVAG